MAAEVNCAASILEHRTLTPDWRPVGPNLPCKVQPAQHPRLYCWAEVQRAHLCAKELEALCSTVSVPWHNCMYDTLAAFLLAPHCGPQKSFWSCALPCVSTPVPHRKHALAYQRCYSALFGSTQDFTFHCGTVRPERPACHLQLSPRIHLWPSTCKWGVCSYKQLTLFCALW